MSAKKKSIATTVETTSPTAEQEEGLAHALTPTSTGDAKGSIIMSVKWNTEDVVGTIGTIELTRGLGLGKEETTSN